MDERSRSGPSRAQSSRMSQIAFGSRPSAAPDWAVGRVGAPFVKTQFRTQNRVPTFAGTALGAVDKGALHTSACVEAESLLFGGEFAARMVNRTLREGLVKAHRQVFVAYSVMLLMLIFIDDVR